VALPNKKALRQVALGVVLAMVVLLSVATNASASGLVPRRRFSGPLSSPIWSWNFESGTQWTNGGPTHPCGNNPGQVVTNIVHGETHSGYYTCSGTDGGATASFPSLDLIDRSVNPEVPAIHTSDLYAEVWIYIPTVSLAGNGAWISLWTAETEGWNYAITVDSGNDRKAFLWTNLINPNGQANPQTSNVQWPFDKWFKIGVETHLRPTGQTSWIILYQDGVQIDRMDLNLPYATAPQIWMYHWGLYMGGGQNIFTVYNDDIALYDLTP
jgi:hypothetical protein